MVGDEFRVGAYLAVEIVRDFNLGEWRKGPSYYFGAAPTWWRPSQEVLDGIQNPTFDVEMLLQAVPAYAMTDAGIRASWAHHMALHAACHPWPNANHRTAMLSFNFALAAAQNMVVGFAQAGRGHALVEQSHAQRDQDGGDTRW